MHDTTADDHADASRPYTPLLALPWWDTIGPFLSPLVEQAADKLDVDVRVLYPVVTPFVLWCWQRKGLELDAPRMFRQQRIESFITSGMTGMSRGSRNTFRGRLLRVAEALDFPESQEPLRRIGRSAPTPPYSSAERAELHSWATARNTSATRRDAAVLLALGFGAGLPTRELLEVRTRHVQVDGSVIDVLGATPRTVPVEPEWRATLARGVLESRDPDCWLFRSNRTGASSGQVTDFVRRSATDLDVRPARMRSTWLVARLRRDDPVDSLLRESGLRTYAALDRYRAFLTRD